MPTLLSILIISFLVYFIASSEKRKNEKVEKKVTSAEAEFYAKYINYTNLELNKELKNLEKLVSSDIEGNNYILEDETGQESSVLLPASGSCRDLLWIEIGVIERILKAKTKA